MKKLRTAISASLLALFSAAVLAQAGPAASGRHAAAWTSARSARNSASNRARPAAN
jgi:hypothetical protein